MKTNPRLFIFRPFFLIAIGMAILGGMTYQWIWRTKVLGGPQDLMIVNWIMQNSILREKTGSITAVHLEKIGSTFSFGNRPIGCYHYVLSTSRGPTEIWVSWHQYADQKAVEVERLEIASDGERHSLWAAAKEGER